MFNISNLRLNGLNDDAFKVSLAQDEKIGDISRNDLIVTGRACATEYFGRQINSMRKLSADNGYHCRTKDNAQYAELSRKHMEKKLLFCAAQTAKSYGQQAPMNADQVRNNSSLWKDPIFLHTMAAIDSEVITPLFFDVLSDISSVMMNWQSVGLGRTKEITIMSNDVFFFEDSSWGATRNTTKNRLYNDTITITPTVQTANASIGWFQMVASDGGMDAGWYYAAIMRGMYSKIMAKFTKALTTAAASTKYVPSYLTFPSYTSAHWAEATVACATANGVPRDQVFAFGAYQALQTVLPAGTASDAALTYNLGPEWMSNGFLSMAGRVPLVEVQQAMVPGTVNNLGTMIFPTDQIYIAGRVGQALAPMYGAFAEGSPVTIELTPSQTALFEIDIEVSAIFEISPIFASKVAVINNVT